MDGSTVSDAQVAAQIWAESQPHAPTALLAYLYRQNLPFPVTGLPPVAPGLDRIQSYGITVERYGYEYLRFYCPDCKTSMFQPATHIGMANARHIARIHKPDCCAERASWNRENVWPDSLGG